MTSPTGSGLRCEFSIQISFMIGPRIERNSSNVPGALWVRRTSGRCLRRTTAYELERRPCTPMEANIDELSFGISLCEVECHGSVMNQFGIGVGEDGGAALQLRKSTKCRFTAKEQKLTNTSIWGNASYLTPVPTPNPPSPPYTLIQQRQRANQHHRFPSKPKSSPVFNACATHSTRPAPKKARHRASCIVHRARRPTSVAVVAVVRPAGLAVHLGCFSTRNRPRGAGRVHLCPLSADRYDA